MQDNQTTAYTVEGQVADARAAVGDITAEAQFCVSEIGVLRREDREIALASEVLRLRAALLKVRHYLRPGDGSHYPHATTYAVQEIDEVIHGKR